MTAGPFPAPMTSEERQWILHCRTFLCSVTQAAKGFPCSVSKQLKRGMGFPVGLLAASSKIKVTSFMHIHCHLQYFHIVIYMA